MRTLYLLRHAKSSWGDDRIADRDRPLDTRGERAAVLIGQFMRQRGWLPDLVLCSNARRARDTLALAAARLPKRPKTSIEAGLYLAGADTLLRRLREVEDEVESVLLVGHNPDLHDLTQDLAGAGDPEALARLERKFPTGALAVLELDDRPWRDLRRGRARLACFAEPKRLV